MVSKASLHLRWSLWTRTYPRSKPLLLMEIITSMSTPLFWTESTSLWGLRTSTFSSTFKLCHKASIFTFSEKRINKEVEDLLWIPRLRSNRSAIFLMILPNTKEQVVRLNEACTLCLFPTLKTHREKNITSLRLFFRFNSRHLHRSIFLRWVRVCP